MQNTRREGGHWLKAAPETASAPTTPEPADEISLHVWHTLHCHE